MRGAYVTAGLHVALQTGLPRPMPAAARIKTGLKSPLARTLLYILTNDEMPGQRDHHTEELYLDQPIPGTVASEHFQ
jgi:hypothetical protein